MKVNISCQHLDFMKWKSELRLPLDILTVR